MRTAVIDEAGQHGHCHGWASANYANAYGQTESMVAEAHRRAHELYPGQDQMTRRIAYRAGFLAGWRTYHEENDE